MKKFSHNILFGSESGHTLEGIEVAYHTIGHLSPSKDNVVWVCHALTANSDVQDWWEGLFGTERLFDPEKHFIICANILGSCYGSTGPLSLNAKSGQPYYHDFPLLTIRDLVKAHKLLAAHLGIEKIQTLIGGSLGGFQAMEWAIDEPERIENLILIATAAKHSAWGIAFNESQRLAIESDYTWLWRDDKAGWFGLRAARAIALLSYRHYDAYNETQSDKTDKLDDFKASSYQRYQGKKLVDRFNAHSYYALTKTMDTHNVGRGRISTERSLGLIKAKTHVIGISTDVLFPPVEQIFLAKHIHGATLDIIESSYGHDGFLIETESITELIQTRKNTPTLVESK
jgi:homoserine O-acetyltransferase